MSAQTGRYSEIVHNNLSDFTAVASTASEASLLAMAANPKQPMLFPSFFDQNAGGIGRIIVVEAQGVFSNTGTPTLIFQARLGPTAGSAQLGGTSVGVSAAITTASGVTNAWWSLYLALTCRIPGQGTGNCQLAGAGYVQSPVGFTSPFTYSLQPTTPPTATWTATLDGALAQYINLSITWSASSASNTITLKHLAVHGHN